MAAMLSATLDNVGMSLLIDENTILAEYSDDRVPATGDPREGREAPHDVGWYDGQCYAAMAETYVEGIGSINSSVERVSTRTARETLRVYFNGQRQEERCEEASE